MGASFRKVEQIIELAGCDLLTISPELLAQLQKREGSLQKKLSAEASKAKDIPNVHLDEKTYRFEHNQDQMAVEKLSEGIRSFYADARKLEKYAQSLIGATAA
jgi:transaldolase